MVQNAARPANVESLFGPFEKQPDVAVKERGVDAKRFLRDQALQVVRAVAFYGDDRRCAQLGELERVVGFEGP